MTIASTDFLADEAHTWYVVFTPGNNDFWWQRFMKAGFRHCNVIRGDGTGSIMVSHHGFRLDIRSIPVPAYELAMAQVKGGYHVLEYKHEVECKPTYRTVMTCVSAVINVIGLRGVLALTPYSLYRALIRQGAAVLEA